MKYKLKASAFLTFLLLSLQLCAQTGGIILPNTFNNLQTSHDQAHQIIPDGGMTITAPGSYHIIENITGEIVVDANDVFIEMNGFTLSGKQGQANASITINADHKNILIQNGHIAGYGSIHNGIEVKEGSSVVVLKDLYISSCSYAMTFSGVEGNEIKCNKVINCFAYGCIRGFSLGHTTMSIFEGCDTCHCSHAGFLLFNCNYNKFKKCKSIKTGSSDSSKDAVGFSSFGGVDNLFYECMAEGIYKGGESDWDRLALGFLFSYDEYGVPETESKIVNCLVDSVTGSGWGGAFGIRLEVWLNDEITTVATGDLVTTATTIGEDYVYTELSWSPQCDFVAFGEFRINLDVANYKLVRFNGSDITEVITRPTRFSAVLPTDLFPTRVAFSPDGQFILVNGRDNAGEPDLNIYDVVTGTLLDSVSLAADNLPYAVWFNCGRKLVLSGPANEQFYVYLFDGKNLLLSQTFTGGGINVGGPLSVSPDDKFLAINWFGDSVLNIVDLNSLTLKDSIDPVGNGDLVNSRFNPLACCGKYFVAALYSDTALGEVSLFVHQYDSTTATLSTVESLPYTDIADAQWHPTGKYLAVSRGETARVIYIYRFNPQTETLEKILEHPTVVGEGVINIAWSPCGSFLAIIGSKRTDTNIDFEIVELGDSVNNCLVDGNKVANSSGGICSIGIFGCSCCNGIMQNVAYNNCINFNQSVLDVWCNGAAAIDQLHFNVSIPHY